MTGYREESRGAYVQVFVVLGNIEIRERNQAKDKEGYTVWIFGTIPSITRRKEGNRGIISSHLLITSLAFENTDLISKEYNRCQGPSLSLSLCVQPLRDEQLINVKESGLIDAVTDTF